MTPESLAKGKEYLEQALTLDANYAPAYTAMAEYYWASALWGFMAGSEAMPRAKTAALAALRLDDTVAEARAQLGMARGIGEFDWAGAEQEFRCALELNPASPNVHFHYAADCLQAMGRLEEALSEARRALELDPLSLPYNNLLGFLYSAVGQHERAIAQHRRTLDLHADWYTPHWFLALAYERMSRLEEAIVAAQVACELSGRIAVTLGTLARVYALAGRRGEAQALLEELTTRRQTTYVPPMAMAMVYRGLGEADPFLKWLEKGVEERDPMIVCSAKAAPGALRGHPRYLALLRKMNLED